MDDTPPAACPPAAAELEPPGSAPRKYGERPSPDEFEEEELAVGACAAMGEQAGGATPHTARRVGMGDEARDDDAALLGFFPRRGVTTGDEKYPRQTSRKSRTWKWKN